MNGDADALVRAVLASGVTLPVPAPGFLRFQAAAADDTAGPKALAAAVIDDPALTGALLRVASSPVFRPRSAPRNVLEAVSLLGRTRSLATVASTALRSRCDGLDASAVDSLWRAGARAADAAFWACRASSCKSLADLTYLAALLQDVGTVVVLRRTPELAGLLRCAEPDLEAGIHQLDTASGTVSWVAAGLGADVPVFVHGRNTFAEGVGEAFTDVDLPPDRRVGRQRRRDRGVAQDRRQSRFRRTDAV